MISAIEWSEMTVKNNIDVVFIFFFYGHLSHLFVDMHDDDDSNARVEDDGKF